MALDAGWACGKEVDDDVRLDAAGMRQSIAWELALRNVKRIEASEAEALLRRETQCEAVRDVRVRHVAALKLCGLCGLPTRRQGLVYRQDWLCYWPVLLVSAAEAGLGGGSGEQRTTFGKVCIELVAMIGVCALQVRLKSLKRRARLMYLPAYVADYVFGEQARVLA